MDTKSLEYLHAMEFKDKVYELISELEENGKFVNNVVTRDTLQWLELNYNKCKSLFPENDYIHKKYYTLMLFLINMDLH